MKRTVIIGVGALAILIVAGWLIHSCANSKNSFVYSGTIETREIQIGSKLGGRVIQVLVEEGQAVKAGTLLVQFEFDDVKAQRAQALAQLEQTQADYHRLQRGNRPEEIAQARANAQMQRAMLDAAESGPRSQELRQAEADYPPPKLMQRTPRSTFNEWTHSYAAHRLPPAIRQRKSHARFYRSKGRVPSPAPRSSASRYRKEDIQAAQERYHQAQAAADLMQHGYRKEDIAALEPHRKVMTQAAKASQALDSRGPLTTVEVPATATLTAKQKNRQRRHDLYQQMRALVDGGGDQSDVARQLDISLRTVQRWIQAGAFPERTPRRYPHSLDVYAGYLDKRLLQAAATSASFGEN